MTRQKPDLLALAMRQARDDMEAGRVPKHPPEDADESDEVEQGQKRELEDSYQ